MRFHISCLSCLLFCLPLPAQPDPDPLEEQYEQIVSTSFREGKMEEALVRFQSLYQEARKAGNADVQLGALASMGVSFNRLGQPDSAIVQYTKALDLARETGDKSYESNICSNICVLYANLKRLDEALVFAQQSVESAKESEDPEDLIFALQTKGTLETVSGHLEEAVLTLQECLDRILALPDEDPDTKARLIVKCGTSQLGNLSLMEGKGAEIRRCIRMVEPYLDRLPENSVESLGYKESLAQALIATGDYNGAIRLLQERLSNRDNSSTSIHLYRKWLSRAYAGANRWKEAYETMSQGYFELDSLSRLDIQQQLSEFSTRFETQQKELEIERLQKQEAQRKLLIFALAAGLLILTGIIFLLIILRKRQKAQEELRRTREYIDGLESERARLAKELHDGIANDLLGLEMNLRNSSQPSQDTADRIAQLRENVRNISHDLIPPQFQYTNLSELLQETLERVQSDTIRIIYRCSPQDGWDDLSTETALELYRATQELVGNALRHSGADTIKVDLDREEKLLTLSVSDNGVFEGTAPGKSGIGRRTLEERMHLLGARLDYSFDRGTRATITMEL